MSIFMYALFNFFKYNGLDTYLPLFSIVIMYLKYTYYVVVINVNIKV